MDSKENTVATKENKLGKMENNLGSSASSSEKLGSISDWSENMYFQLAKLVNNLGSSVNSSDWLANNLDSWGCMTAKSGNNLATSENIQEK